MSDDISNDEGPFPEAASPADDVTDLFEHAPCGYLSLGPDGRIGRVNATFCEWTGHAAGDLVGARFHQLLNMAGRIYFETHISPLLRMQGCVDEVALEIVTAGGQKLSVLVSAAERRDDNGQHHFTRVVLFRATQRRSYERQLVSMRETAERGLVESRALEDIAKAKFEAERETAELREQFIAVLGHDLRNPLAAIGSGLDLLNRLPQGEKGVKVLQLMRGSVDRMAGLIDSILDFARGRLGGGLPVELRLSDVTVLIEHAVSELRIAYPEREIGTDIRLPEPLPVDASRFGQLLSNLVGNALTHGAKDAPIKVGAFVEPDHLEVWVANMGEPIPQAAMERLFQPFFRGEVRESQQGLGLGLHIASEIARAHAGTLSVSSTTAETRFTFRMPIER